MRNTEVTVNGQTVLVSRVQGIVFGNAVTVQQESYELLLHGIPTTVTKE